MKLIVIGYTGPGDESYACAVHFLLSSGWDDVERYLDQGTSVGFYNMEYQPELGDGIDAIGPDTEMVIALHLHGMKGQDPVSAHTEMYNRNNGSLLAICKRLNVPLLVVGEQPSNVDNLVALYIGDEVLTL